jgi:hypothetical protein
MKANTGNKILAAALLSALLSVAAPASAQTLAARVNGATIPLELVDRQFEELLRERKLHMARLNNPAKVKEMKREALDNLIRTELLWQQAKSGGLVVTDEEVEKSLAQARSPFPSHEAFVRRIEMAGFTEAGYREYTRKILSGDRMAERIVERDVTVSDDDVEQFYKTNPRLFRRDEHLKARHILVGVGANASAEEREAARRKITDLVTRARAGESFDTLARNNSDDATRQWGGQLDAFTRGQMVKPFEDAAFALEPGEMSGPVETQYGFHLIKLEERIEAATITLDGARERIREYLRGTRGKDAIDREVEALRAGGKVEVLTPL